ncbi:MAG TPA: DUF2127 domain-containing protein [Casimicrobiaceae bacterium]|nr:DUF2127 domain-containing protein [Casimicrobiaceae bacterium]
MVSSSPRDRGWWLASVRVVAVVEFIKGALVLFAGAGLLTLLHRDVRDVAEHLVHHLHLDPASQLPEIFLELAGRVTSSDLWLLALGALAYAVVRIVEAYGLWCDRVWAQWFGAISGLIYVPFELHALARGVTPLKLTTLVINLAVVWILTAVLMRRRPRRTGPR